MPVEKVAVLQLPKAQTQCAVSTFVFYRARALSRVYGINFFLLLCLNYFVYLHCRTLKKINIMENNKVLIDTVLRNRGIESLSGHILAIRKDLDLILYDDCENISSRQMISLLNISERLSGLYTLLYKEMCS